ncbi:MAG: ParB N-terminal domain-containing protein, partial [Planctomycetes bacterium]|nr:ParB N-terminal domain-containing protein [Planctomycetota bacterium]
MSHVQAEDETPGTDSIVEETHATNISIYIDEQFRSLLPDPGAEAVQQLTESLRAEGCREPLIVWEYDGRQILLDGHHRYRICNAHHLPYQVIVKTAGEIPDRDAAMDWIDRNQLARRNLTPEQFALVLGRLYNRQKRTQGGTGANQHTAQSAQHEHSARNQGKTAEKLAQEHGVSPATVRRAGEFAEAVDTLKSQDPDIETKVVHGAVTRRDVIE